MKGQISIEFISMMAIIVVFILSLLGVMSYYHKSEMQEKSDDAVINLIDYLQNEVIIASKMRTGYINSFTLPSKINNKDYTILTYNNSIIINYEENEHLSIIPTVNGSFNVPNNVIKKVEGGIQIN